MTANKRIFLNIVATYGRSLYALVIGLFCGRWALMAPGQTAYGILGVVGGLTAFIAYFNGVLGGSISRFYAVTVGKESTNPEAGLEECRMWFTTAVVIHTIVPVILIVIGYPIGEYAVRHWLTMPPERVAGPSPSSSPSTTSRRICASAWTRNLPRAKPIEGVMW